MIEWHDAKKSHPKLHLEEWDGLQWEESEPCLLYGRDHSGQEFVFGISCYTREEDCTNGEWCDDYDYSGIKMSEIIAWSPLPEPPKLT